MEDGSSQVFPQLWGVNHAQAAYLGKQVRLTNSRRRTNIACMGESCIRCYCIRETVVGIYIGCPTPPRAIQVFSSSKDMGIRDQANTRDCRCPEPRRISASLHLPPAFRAVLWSEPGAACGKEESAAIDFQLIKNG